MRSTSLRGRNVAEAYLALLADRGVDYLFANAGTDFAPIIEALAEQRRARSAHCRSRSSPCTSS